MTRKEAYALLFEPLNGWTDQAGLDEDFAHYERLLAKHGEVTPQDLVTSFEQQRARVDHLVALGEHLLRHPRESDAYPDSSG